MEPGSGEQRPPCTSMGWVQRSLRNELHKLREGGCSSGRARNACPGSMKYFPVSRRSNTFSQQRFRELQKLRHSTLNEKDKFRAKKSQWL